MALLGGVDWAPLCPEECGIFVVLDGYQKVLLGGYKACVLCTLSGTGYHFRVQMLEADLRNMAVWTTHLGLDSQIQVLPKKV